MTSSSASSSSKSLSGLRTSTFGIRCLSFDLDDLGALLSSDSLPSSTPSPAIQGFLKHLIEGLVVVEYAVELFFLFLGHGFRCDSNSGQTFRSFHLHTRISIFPWFPQSFL